MVCAVHHKLDPLADGAEFPDDKPVAQKFVVVRHVLLEPFCAVHIVIVGIIAHLNIGAGDYILDVNHLPDVFIGVNAVGVWP